MPARASALTADMAESVAQGANYITPLLTQIVTNMVMKVEPGRRELRPNRPAP